ncbi:MAG: hypothetical protein JWO67_5608 [Streptosporangiaceae bacterium]|jgi:hypothetical protein|nr:hypothetical protein [Streptosporangiaceae bacterium]
MGGATIIARLIVPTFADITYTGPLPPLRENASVIVKKIIDDPVGFTRLLARFGKQ